MYPENVSIGQKLRKRRSDFDLSLRDLARRTGLTASYLSQIERGMVSPSLNSLRKIAECLEVPLLFLLSDTSRQSPVVRADSRPRMDLENSTVQYQILTPNLDHKMEAFCGTVDSDSSNIVRPLSVPTEELILVQSGSLRVRLDQGEYILNAGDTIYFEGRQLREIACASSEKATWISVITPPVF